MLRPKSFYWVVLIVASLTLAVLTGEVRASSTDPQPPLCQAALVVEPAVIDFGSIVIGETGTRTVSVSNIGRETLTFSAVVVSEMESVFTIASQPSTLTLPPGMSTTFTAGFSPIAPSTIPIGGTITINSNGGNFTIALRARGIETTAPTVRVNSPVGGEKIESGKATTITFSAEDNDILAVFIVFYSINGGESFIEIGRVPGSASSIVWNVPDGLKTDRALVRVVAFDRSGNSASAISGLFSIDASSGPVMQPAEIKICFDPPTFCQGSPSNPRFCDGGPSCSNSTGGTDPCSNGNPTGLPEGLIGYNIYRLPLPPEGPVPSPDEVIKEENLVGAVPPDITCFTDTVSSSKGTDFCYGVTSFCGNGGNSAGVVVCRVCPDLPLLKNLRFSKGSLFFDVSGSLIKLPAQLIVNDKETFQVQDDSTRIFFVVPKTARSEPSSLSLRRVIKKGVTVQLKVRNADGKLSRSVSYTRPR
jgi:hypothetical protein